MPPLPTLRFCALALSLVAAAALRSSAAGGTHATIDADLALRIDGKKVFPIGFTTPPPPGGKTPTGKDGIEELHDAGATFLRTGAGKWDDAVLEREQQWHDAARKNGMHCWVYLGELASIGPGQTQREAMLRKVVNQFKDQPSMGVWKGADEPEWGKLPLPPLIRGREIVRELDPNHPCTIIQAPRGTVETMRPYNVTGEIVGADVYPIGYPPGTHSLLPNKEISMVGDYTHTMMQVADGKMPVWMVLQIAWSGVVKPGKTLRFPTFPQERFMTYQAIINGARGLMYFGGNLPQAMTPEDRALGWNWHFWNRVLRPVIEEIGEKSPLYPALTAANSKLPVKVSGASDIEYCVREVGDDLFLLACKREGATVQAEFSGLPSWAGTAEVMYESPREVQAAGGKFKDWFAPFDVHVYRFRRSK